MKTVAKKAVKKAPAKVSSKTAAKVATKVATKKAVMPAKTASKAASKPVPKSAPKAAVKAVVKVVAKTSKKSVVKSIPKPVAKSAVKAAAKPAQKPLPKAAAKSAVKTVSKVVAAQKISKPVAKPAAKVKPAKVVDKVVDKVVEAPVKKAAKPVKPAEPSKAIEKSKAASKPSKEESNLKQPMVIASKIAPTEIKDLSPATPAQSKARTSRLASLTVPSMAQAVASTAAKSSYGPHVPSLAIIPPPQFAAKHDPKLANNWKTKTAEEMTDAELLAMPDSEYMNIKQMMYFRLKLLQLKQGILASAGATTEHLRDESAVVPDPTDRATIEEEHALELRTRDRERKLLKKIEQSIVRIDAGDYGYCDETGEAIGVGRLLARPTATLSLEAQQRRELKQKMFGD
jgi:DnaK suppressor protein